MINGQAAKVSERAHHGSGRKVGIVDSTAVAIR
jgi:hypothetical protein